jgi:hypothetical protein
VSRKSTPTTGPLADASNNAVPERVAPLDGISNVLDRGAGGAVVVVVEEVVVVVVDVVVVVVDVVVDLGGLPLADAPDATTTTATPAASTAATPTRNHGQRDHEAIDRSPLPFIVCCSLYLQGADEKQIALGRSPRLRGQAYARAADANRVKGPSEWGV